MIVSKSSWHYRFLMAIHMPRSDMTPKKSMPEPETSLGYRFKIATVLFWMSFLASASLFLGYLSISHLVEYGHLILNEPGQWVGDFQAFFGTCMSLGSFAISLAMFNSFFGRALGVLIASLLPWLSSPVTVID